MRQTDTSTRPPGGGKRHPNQEKKEANLKPQRGTGRRKTQKRQGEKLPKNTADQTATGERQEKHRGKMTKKKIKIKRQKTGTSTKKPTLGHRKMTRRMPVKNKPEPRSFSGLKKRFFVRSNPRISDTPDKNSSCVCRDYNVGCGV